MVSEIEDQQGRVGRIFQINVSQGGVPKLAVPQVEVSALGLNGDCQANTEVHGGVERAVCLYSLERILSLQVEGHAIYPGAIGENLTLTGLDWNLIVPGVRLRIGGDVLLEVTRYTSPCKTIASAFTGRVIKRVLQQEYPGWSRVYARVLQEGAVRVGEKIHLEPVGD
jgi:MOSC domain-containing protein YiiM